MRVGIFALAALLSLSGNAAAQSGNAAAQSLVERGNYLVNTVLTCGNCHTPKGPGGDVAEKAFSGFLAFDEPPFKATASNITQDKETGSATGPTNRSRRCCAKASSRTVFRWRW